MNNPGVPHLSQHSSHLHHPHLQASQHSHMTQSSLIANQSHIVHPHSTHSAHLSHLALTSTTPSSTASSTSSSSSSHPLQTAHPILLPPSPYGSDKSDHQLSPNGSSSLAQMFERIQHPPLPPPPPQPSPPHSAGPTGSTNSGSYTTGPARPPLNSPHSSSGSIINLNSPNQMLSSLNGVMNSNQLPADDESPEILDAESNEPNHQFVSALQLHQLHASEHQHPDIIEVQSHLHQSLHRQQQQQQSMQLQQQLAFNSQLSPLSLSGNCDDLKQHSQHVPHHLHAHPVSVLHNGPGVIVSNSNRQLLGNISAPLSSAANSVVTSSAAAAAAAAAAVSSAQQHQPLLHHGCDSLTNISQSDLGPTSPKLMKTNHFVHTPTSNASAAAAAAAVARSSLMSLTNRAHLVGGGTSGPGSTSGSSVGGDDGEEINTKDLAHRISAELKRYSIPQAIFAQRVLCRSQGTLSDLLRNPKPWSKLKSGRETFRRMHKWLEEPEFQRMTTLRVAGKQMECQLHFIFFLFSTCLPSFVFTVGQTTRFVESRCFLIDFDLK